jgi:hypothetical protein
MTLTLGWRPFIILIVMRVERHSVLEVDADGAHSKIELLCVSAQYDAHTNNKSLP